jgi:hypothetical protein
MAPSNPAERVNGAIDALLGSRVPRAAPIRGVTGHTHLNQHACCAPPEGLATTTNTGQIQYRDAVGTFKTLSPGAEV